MHHSLLKSKSTAQHLPTGRRWVLSPNGARYDSPGQRPGTDRSIWPKPRRGAIAYVILSGSIPDVALVIFNFVLLQEPAKLLVDEFRQTVTISERRCLRNERLVMVARPGRSRRRRFEVVEGRPTPSDTSGACRTAMTRNLGIPLACAQSPLLQSSRIRAVKEDPASAVRDRGTAV